MPDNNPIYEVIHTLDAKNAIDNQNSVYLAATALSDPSSRYNTTINTQGFISSAENDFLGEKLGQGASLITYAKQYNKLIENRLAYADPNSDVGKERLKLADIHSKQQAIQAAHQTILKMNTRIDFFVSTIKKVKNDSLQEDIIRKFVGEGKTYDSYDTAKQNIIIDYTQKIQDTKARLESAVKHLETVKKLLGGDNVDENVTQKEIANIESGFKSVGGGIIKPKPLRVK